MCLSNESGLVQSPRAYKDDGIPCVLSPEGSLPGGQQERTDQLTDYSTPNQVYWTGRCGGISNVDNLSESSKTSLRNTTELDIQKQSLVVPFRYPLDPGFIVS